jgi:serine/threonine-protein kinase haspin
VRGERTFEIQIVTSRLRNVSLDSLSKSETALRSLLSCATTKTILPFTDAFTTPDFAELLPDGVSPTVTKVGEASYSEVFSVGEGDSAVVVKVVPLLGKAAPHSKGKSAAELPDCSAIPDVVREIEITRRMSQTPGGGFVEFLG